MQARGIIVGGGIAGLTAALALQQQGIPVRVFESAPRLLPVGSGIWMAPNAMQVFDRLGLAEQINAAGVPLADIRITDGVGRTIMQSEQAGIKARFGYTTTAILRSRLQEILLHALTPDTVHLSKEVKDIAGNGAHMRVSFRDGSAVEAPFVIAADGIHSVVRGRLFPQARLSPVRDIVWRGLSTISLQPAFKKAIVEAWQDGFRFGFSEVADGLVDWFAVAPSHLPAGGREGILPLLMKAFSRFAYPVGDILAGGEEPRIIRNEIRDLEPLPVWHSGRVCLIGDAAHASTPYMGQGGCQAVEDGWVIAQCLRQEQAPEAAFEKFQQIRAAKARHIVVTSRMIGRAGGLRSVGAAVRNMIIRSTPQRLIDRRFHDVYTLNY